jgi:hypothetical protein
MIRFDSKFLRLMKKYDNDGTGYILEGIERQADP